MSFQRLHEIRKEVAKDNVFERPVGHLSLFTYTNKCHYNKKNWNNTTKKARGIIFDTHTGTVVCRPFTKFFNLEEMSNTKVKILARKLQKQKAFATKKLDGTCVAVWYYDGEWRTSTPGHMMSPHAKYAAKTLLPRYDFDALPTDLTYMFEMITPWDRRDKIVNYGDRDDLTMLAAFETRWDEVEVPRSRLEMLAKQVGIPVVEEYPINPEAPWETPIPDGEEGFVLRFEDGQRIKVKSRWFMRWHRISENVTYKNVTDLIRFERQTLNQVKKDAPPNVQEKIEEVLSHILKVKSDIEREVDRWWYKAEDHTDYEACAKLFKQAGQIQRILFARMRGQEDDYQKRLWMEIYTRLKEDGIKIEDGKEG